MVHPRKFVRDSAGIALSQYLARAMMLARGWAAAVALGPGGFGHWNALNLIFDYGSYASLGSLQGLDLELPSAVAAGDRARARALMAGAWSVILAGGLAFALALALVLALRPHEALTLGPGLAALMALAALLQLAFQYFASSLRAYGRFHAVSSGQAIQAVVGAGLGVLLVWRLGLFGLLAGWLLGSVLALAGMRRAGPEIPLLARGPGEGVRLARNGFPIFAFFVTSLVLRSVDRLALVRFGAPESLGLYSLGLMAAGSTLYIPESVAFVLFPRIASAWRGTADRDAARDQVLRAQRALCVVLPLAVGLALVWAEPVVRAWLPAYAPGLASLRLLVAGALVLSAATVPSYFLLGAKRERSLLKLGLVAAAINTALVFGVAARRPEPAAVALASTCGYALFAALLLARAAGELFERPAARAGFVVRSLGPVVWGVLAAFLGARMAAGGGAPQVALATTAFIGLYAPALVLFGRGVGLRGLAREWLSARRPV